MILPLLSPRSLLKIRASDNESVQCAAVNFISGSQAAPSICKNVTGLSATYINDAALSTLPATGTPTATATASGSGSGAPTTMTSSSSIAAATTSAAAASLTATHPYGVVGSLMWAGMVVLAMMGFFLA
jgi:hypothetical protein